MKQNLILIGFMGAGKTTIGKLYAKQQGLQLLDTDELIVDKAGMSIPEIFAQKGEGEFRRFETEVLQELLEATDRTVISVGGGLPLRAENRAFLNQLGTVVYLDITEQSVWTRLKGETGRPLLQGDDVEQKIAELLAYRRPIYEAAAHRTISVDDQTPAQIVANLRQIIGAKE